ncbi:MAG: peptide-methionine (R)-S-oxide reductase MsrB [Chitinophagales bacterium]|nr:peptide-methionine (R)-S-oxide reductase MsrB [Chitinophagales bacterium]
MKQLIAISLLIAAFSITSCGQNQPKKTVEKNDFPAQERIVKNEAELKKHLSDDQVNVICHQGTEPPFSGKYNDHHEEGTYTCAACGLPLFQSSTKFNSGTGWPSFFQPIAPNVAESVDNSLGMTRTEVHCARCGGHLGHVFNDGPKPTGMRYCINSLSLNFVAK